MSPVSPGSKSPVRFLLPLAAGLLLGFICPGRPAPALAGQTVIVDRDVPGFVVGNNDPAYPVVGWPPANLGEADNNTVIVNSGTVTWDVVGAEAIIFTGSAPAGATGNRVTVNGGEVRGHVYGGSAESYSGAAAATGNRVTINGGEVLGSVYGGFAASTFGAAAATGNTVTLSGRPTFNAFGSSLYGGNTFSNVGSEAFTGNTLNVWNYSGSAVYDVKNFQFFNFVLPVTQAGPVLTVTGTASLNDAWGSISSTVTGVSTLGGPAPLRPGDSVTLIGGGGGGLYLYAPGFTQTQAPGRHGATLLYDWTLDTGSGALTATLGGARANPQTQALSEGYLAGQALLIQGADLAAEQAIESARRSLPICRSNDDQPVNRSDNVIDCRDDDQRLGLFAALSGGSSSYDTGVDLNGLSLMTGLSYGAGLNPGDLTLGAFFEYGRGSYDTYNSFRNAASVRGDGEAHYLGGGLLGRLDFTAGGPGHFYAEASGRVGGLNNDYSSGDLRDALGRQAGYESSSTYYGLHLGTGYIWNLSEKASLDLHGKYFWTHQDGNDVTLSTGDQLRFDAVDSQRLRGGARFSYAVNEYVSPYLGAAYEHEFDGRAKAATYGYAIEAPELTGGTGIGELGLNFKPSPTLPLSLDLGVQGYVGQREGVTGSLQIKFEF